MSPETFRTTGSENPEADDDSEFNRRLESGNAHLDQGRYEAAERDLLAASERQASRPRPYFSLGLVYLHTQRFDLARTCFERIVEVPGLIGPSHDCLGLIAEQTYDWDQAETHYRAAIAHEFQYASAHHNLGLLLLRQGRYPEGFREFEWRWHTGLLPKVEWTIPRWDGKPFRGRLLVAAEQGAGDVFQFCRFLPELRRHCDRLLFLCHDPLHCMFRDPIWADELWSPENYVVQEADRFVSLGSVPFFLRTAVATVPRPDSYLTPEPRQVALGRCHVPSATLKVGLTWGGNPKNVLDRFRSCPLSHFSPLWSVDRVAFYSLQKGAQRDELEALPNRPAALRDVDALQHDFADTAAILSQLDLVITVDTALVHLAGGLGIPTWCLLSKRCDWRWMEDRTDTVWYPRVELWRQRQLGDWDELLCRVADKLRECAASADAAPTSTPTQ